MLDNFCWGKTCSANEWELASVHWYFFPLESFLRKRSTLTCVSEPEDVTTWKWTTAEQRRKEFWLIFKLKRPQHDMFEMSCFILSLSLSLSLFLLSHPHTLSLILSPTFSHQVKFCFSSVVLRSVQTSKNFRPKIFLTNVPGSLITWLERRCPIASWFDKEETGFYSRQAVDGIESRWRIPNSCF